MSKNRLLQIVNRLELNPKDKNDLINVINTNTDKLEKLLENVPEDLDTLKEIANTPANFLNNNNELGGMINMPFGFNNINFNKKLVYNHKYVNVRDFDCGILENWYYGKVLVSTIIKGRSPILDIFNINDITGKDNEKTIGNSAYIYYQDRHIYISASENSHATFTFVSFSGYNKLPLSFTTPYIVGNDTQEHLDELYIRLDENTNFSCSVTLLPLRHIGHGYFHKIGLNKYILYIIDSEDGLRYRIGGSTGQDLKSLIRLNELDDNLIVTKVKLGDTPDWNASKNEAGYIDNKTHYDPCNTALNWTQIPQSNNYEAVVNVISGVNLMRYPKLLDNNIIYKYVKLDRENVSISLGMLGNISITFDTESNNYTITANSATKDKIRVNNSITVPHQLDDLFIPDTIARVADYERPHIKFSYVNTDYNLKILASLEVGRSYVCDLFGSATIPENTDSNWVIQNGEYYNGVITGIKENMLIQYDVNFETGVITVKQAVDIELIGSEVKLDVCTAGSTEAARNLELLNKAYFALGDHFTVNIDAGIGVAKFIPETGGEGHITTAAGVNVHYTIGNDGSVVKTNEVVLESTYDYYTSSGGTLSEDKWKKCQKYAYEPFMISATGSTTIPDDLLNSGGTSWFIDFYWKYCFITGGIPIKTVQWDNNIPKKFAPVYDESQTYTIDFANKTITKD